MNLVRLWWATFAAVTLYLLFVVTFGLNSISPEDLRKAIDAPAPSVVNVRDLPFVPLVDGGMGLFLSSFFVSFCLFVCVVCMHDGFTSGNEAHSRGPCSAHVRGNHHSAGRSGIPETCASRECV